MAEKTPLELIRLYWGNVWNKRETGLIEEICADPIIRHDPMSVTPLSHKAQMDRVAHQSEAMHPCFTHEVLLSDDTYVCSVWNMFTRKGDGEPTRISGIEVFKAEDGRFTDCWNSAYSMVYWGREGTNDDPLAPNPPRAPWPGQGTKPAVERTPEEVVRLYHRQVWGEGDTALLREIVADPLARHEPGGLKYLGIDHQIARVAAQHAETAPHYSYDVLIADGDLVCAVWNMRTTRGAPLTISGIEVFRVEDGRIVECWSPPETKGAWGRRGDAAVPKDLPAPHLLAHVGEIDNSWMQSVFLHAGLDLPRIAMVRTRPIGHGNLSTTVQAIVGYNQAVTDEPQTVICKFNSNHPEAQAAVARFSPYRTEVEAYRYLGSKPPMRTPRAYYAAVSDDGLIANLVLEDLGAFCEAGDQIAGCGQVEAEAVVRELARMHAAYWGAPELKTFAWMGANRTEGNDAPQLYASGVEIFRARYAGDLGPDDMAVVEAFAPLVEKWTRLRPETATLIHTDPRVDNIMFDRRAPGRVDAYLIDWQCASHGEPQYDVAYFLTGSLGIDDRRACERRLIAGHAAVIAEIDPAYTEERALAAYAQNIVSGLYMTVVASNVMPDTAHNRSLLTALARRNCAAVRDWNGLQILQQ